MANKDYREIQISSSLLVFIFIGVLVLGVFVFLLGVSVGKKQALVSPPAQILTERIQEPLKEPVTRPETGKAAEESVKPETQPVKPQKSSPASSQPTVKTSPPPLGLYYVQVAAFTTRAQAQTSAESYRRQGYPVIITEPKPTDSKAWFRVRIGAYDTREKAVATLEKLNAAAGRKTDFRVVKD